MVMNMLCRGPTKNLQLSFNLVIPSICFLWQQHVFFDSNKTNNNRNFSIIVGLPVSSWWQNGSREQRFCRENTASLNSKKSFRGRNEWISVSLHFHLWLKYLTSCFKWYINIDYGGWSQHCMVLIENSIFFWSLFKGELSQK